MVKARPDYYGALWAPVKASGTLVDRVVERIEALLAHDQLSAGSRLPPERELAQMLGVSRPALREAVKTLAARGWLVVRHGQGVFVAQSAEGAMRARLSSLEVSLQDLFAMREVLEVAAAGWAAERATDLEILELAEALERIELARKKPVDFDNLAKLDADFHLRIVEVAKNSFLSQTVGVLQEILSRGMESTLQIPRRFQVSQSEHREIYAAIGQRDSEAAKAAALRHVNGARGGALRRLREESKLKQSRARTGATRGTT